ncbi:MAG: succinate dehydrogenase, hydrophobic membrane anchor protein [Magnetovibrionaceae bacterium]
MEMRSQLGRVRGLGASQHGTGHWWAQRITAIALVPLGIWFVINIIGLIGADYDTAKAWVSHHGNAVFLSAFIIAMTYHAMLGIQVVLEDYIGCEVKKTVALILNKFVFMLCGISSLIAVLRLGLGG